MFITAAVANPEYVIEYIVVLSSPRVMRSDMESISQVALFGEPAVSETAIGESECNIKKWEPCMGFRGVRGEFNVCIFVIEG